MDRSAVIALVFVFAAAVIALLGVYFGDEIVANLPGGQATGIVGGVVILLGLFVTAYKTIRGLEFNRLDEKGFDNLLYIHFRAVSSELLYLVEDALTEAESNSSPLDPKPLIRDMQSAIDQSRAKLAPFATQTIPSIPRFLDRHFAPQRLSEQVEDAVQKLNEITDPARRRKYVFSLIRSVQSDLLRSIQLAGKGR